MCAAALVAACRCACLYLPLLVCDSRNSGCMAHTACLSLPPVPQQRQCISCVTPNPALPAHPLLYALMYHQFVGQQQPLLLLLHCLPAARNAVRQRRQEGLPCSARCRRGYAHRVVGRNDVLLFVHVHMCFLVVCASVVLLVSSYLRVCGCRCTWDTSGLVAL